MIHTKQLYLNVFDTNKNDRLKNNIDICKLLDIKHLNI